MKALHQRKTQRTANGGATFTTIYYVAVCAVLFCYAASFFILPIGQAARGSGELYRCVWQDGRVSEESYASACRDLFCVDRQGDIVLRRGDGEGIITSERVQTLQTALQTASLAELLSLDFRSCNAIERAALAREFSGVLYYSEGDAFRYTTKGLARASQMQTERLALITSSLPPSLLRNTGAREVWIYPYTVVKPEMLVASQINSIVAQEPYFMRGGVLYLKTVSGVRCVAAPPSLTSVAIEGNDYADEGALLPCKGLQELTLPFAGNNKNSEGTLYRGEIAHLFSSSDGYDVPKTLKKVTVTGGRLASHAFYACRGVEEICTCGLAWQDIDEYAFVDCEGLKTLHTPRYGVALPQGYFIKRTAPCGCTEYTRYEP